MTHYLRAEVTRRVDEAFPVWAEVRFPAADGATVTIVEKAPVLGADHPGPLAIACDVLDRGADGTALIRLHHGIGDDVRVPGSAVFSLEEAVREATRRAVGELFAGHPGQRFYYLTLTTPGEVPNPYLSACSYETLIDQDLKWSYADSPFMFFGEEHFARLRPLFQTPGDPGERLAAIERAVRSLDEEGLFSGTALARTDMIVTVEVMPPDHTNTARTLRLNPPGPALTDWLGPDPPPAA